MANLTATEMAPAVGRIALIHVDQCLFIEVHILDVKNAYGRQRLLVTPVAGESSQWVDVSRVIRVLPSREDIAQQHITKAINRL